MKITALKCRILKAPLGSKRFYSSQAVFPERCSFLLEIETDEGVSGWGEGGQWGPAEPVAAIIDDLFAPRLKGRRVESIVPVWEELYAWSRDFARKGPYIEALSAVDVALWDLKGKQLGLPVHELLGGAFRESVVPYATGCYYRGADVSDREAVLEGLRREVAGYIEQGFGFLKIKIGLWPIPHDARRIEAVREAAGTSIGLLADANHAYRAPEAISAGRILEENGYRLFEEPVPPEDFDGYRRVRDALSIAIAGGECEYTRWGFRDLIASGGVDILQPDISVCGGLSEFQKILALATAHNLQVLPHIWGCGVALAASLQALAIVPPAPFRAIGTPFENEPIAEFDRNPNPLRDELLQEPIALVDGRLPIPRGPGLGISIDRDALQRYTVHQI